MYEYPIVVHPTEDHYWSEAVDIPEAHSAGDTIDELLRNALEGLQLALSIYVDQGRLIPPASRPRPDEHIVRLPALTVAKVCLWNAMRQKGMRKSDLLRLLNASPPSIDRLLDFEHSSKIELVERALQAVGQRLMVSARTLDNDDDRLRLATGGAC